MRVFILTLLVALFFACALAVKVNQKPIVVSYPEDTPQSVVDEAIAALKEAGGIVTHEYSLFKGFAAKASDATIETIKAMGEKYMPVVENDFVVSTNDS